MNLRSIARKLGYVMLGSLGTFVVMRAPNPFFIDLLGDVGDVGDFRDLAGSREPLTPVAFAAEAPTARATMRPERLYAAFDGSSRAERAPAPIRCASSGFDVVELTPTYRAVSASYVDRVLEEQAELMGSSRFVPVRMGDRTTGVELLGVRPGKALFALGFRDGDELRDVNGVSIAEPASALEAYGRAARASRIVVGIVRHGKPMLLCFVIC